MLQAIKNSLKAIWPVTIRRFNEKSSCDTADIVQFLRQNLDMHSHEVVHELTENRNILPERLTEVIECSQRTQSAQVLQSIEQNRQVLSENLSQAFELNLDIISNQLTRLIEQSESLLSERFSQLLNKIVEEQHLKISQDLELCENQIQTDFTKTIEQSENIISERFTQVLQSTFDRSSVNTIAELKKQNDILKKLLVNNDAEQKKLIVELKNQNDVLKNQLINTDAEQKKLITELKSQNEILKNQLVSTGAEQKKLIAELKTRDEALKKQFASSNEELNKTISAQEVTLAETLKETCGAIDAVKQQNDIFKKQFDSTSAEQKKLITDVQIGLQDVKKQSTSKLTAVSREISRYRNELAGRIFEPLPNYMEGINTPQREIKIIISLTSYSKRIQFIAPCVYSLLHQTMKPDMVILWLAESDFPHKKADLPQSLLKLQEIGLSIEWCEELHPHKKYYETMRRWPDDIIITVDDDVIYPAQLIENLYKAHQKHPECVCATRVRQIRIDENGQLLPYNDWTLFEGPVEKGPALNLIPTGVGGVLYPPHCLDKRVFDKEVLKELCLFNDDLWLKLMELKIGTPVYKVNWIYPWITYVEGSQENALWHINQGQNQNDLCLEKMKLYFSVKTPALANIWNQAASD